MQVCELIRPWPHEEVYSPTDPLRRSSRSVCATLAEAWRKRRYRAALIGKLSGAEAEAAQTQVWIGFALRCGELPRERGAELHRTYDRVLATLVGMITHPATWTPAR